MISRNVIIVLLLLLGAAPGRSGEPAASPPVPAQATLEKLRGRVYLRRPGTSWTRARRGDPLYVKDRVRAGRGASAVIRYWDGIDVTLEGGTLVEVLDRAAPRDEALRLLLGEVLVDIRRGAGASGPTTRPAEIPFRIRTPRAVAGAEGTRFRVRVGERGSRVAVLEGTVTVEETAGEGKLVLGAEQATAIGRRGRLSESRPLGLPWVPLAAGLRRRERSEEPFFGEVGRFRSSRFLAVVDPRRDALANPARVDRLLQGEGFDLVEISSSPRQGRAQLYRERALDGTPHSGVRDASEASDSAEAFSYRAFDDGRWAGALHLQRVNLRTREDLLPNAPPVLAGSGSRREGTLEGPGISGMIQRAWRTGRRLWGLGLLHQVQELDGFEGFSSTLGGPNNPGRAVSDVRDRNTLVSAGYSWDPTARRDLGLVLRHQEREVTRNDTARWTGGLPAAPVGTPLLHGNSTVLDALWRHRLAGRRTLALRGFLELSRTQRREAEDFDPSRLRVEDELSERASLYGLAVGMAWQPGAGQLLSADLSWQRLDSSADLVLGGGLPALVEDERETRTSLHVGYLRRLRSWDVRTSVEFNRVHRSEGYLASPGAGVTAPLGEKERAWENQFQITMGRWLDESQRLELEFEEREPVSPERILRLRWVRGF